MKKDITRDSPEWRAYAALFEFHKRHGIPEPDNPGYWAGMLKETERALGAAGDGSTRRLLEKYLWTLMRWLEEEGGRHDD